MKSKVKALLCLLVSSLIIAVGQCLVSAADTEIIGFETVGAKERSDEQEKLNSLLYYAVRLNDVEEACKLIERGADVNHVFEGGYTPLVEAVRGWRYSKYMIAMLLSKGANPNLRLNVKGLRPNITAYEMFEQMVADARKEALSSSKPHSFDLYTIAEIRDSFLRADMAFKHS